MNEIFDHGRDGSNSYRMDYIISNKKIQLVIKKNKDENVVLHVIVSKCKLSNIFI
jgi:hypothetical protein